jgi:hypothetical protein
LGESVVCVGMGLKILAKSMSKGAKIVKGALLSIYPLNIRILGLL